MSILRKLRFRTKALFKGSALDNEMTEEMEFHVDMLTQEKMKEGLSRTEARRQSLIEFGGLEQKKEIMRTTRGVQTIENIWKDTVFALRNLRKSPGFTVVVILTLALGIGANTAIFTVVNSILLDPLKYPEPERLVAMSQDTPNSRAAPASGGVFMDWQDNSTLIESMAASHPVDFNLSGYGDPQRVSGWAVSAEFLQVLKVNPIHGRGFVDEDDMPGGNDKVVILTNELWHSQFNADPAVVNTSISLNSESYEIIGVLPPNVLISDDIKFLVPSNIRGIEYKQSRDYMYVCRVIGRLKPGATIEQAETELVAIKDRLRELYPPRQAPWSVAVQDLREAYFGNSRPYLFILLTAVGLVLLIACANVANLLLAKSSTRQAEIALRASLGATRKRIIEQLITESLILAIGGGVTGILLASYLVGPLTKFVDLSSTPILDPSIDLKVLLYVAGVTLLTGVLFGLFPALRLSKPNLMDAMKEGSRGSSGGQHKKVQSVLIIGQTALTVTLLISIGLLLRSFYNASQSNIGFNSENLLSFDTSYPGSKAPTVTHHIQFADAVLEKLKQIPGVKFAAVTASLPMSRRGYGDTISREDQPDKRTDTNANFNAASPDFFKALGIPLLQGRTIDAADNLETSPKVMVVNERLVDMLFPDGDALGQLLHFKDATWEIVGIVGDVRQFSIDSPARPMTYHATIHFPWSTTYVLKTEIPPLNLVDDARKAMAAVDPDQPIANINTMKVLVREGLQGRTIMISLLGIFALTALLLACIGIYGTMSFSVLQRTREMGIRIALGAKASKVISMIQIESIKLVLIGLVLGLLISLGTSKLLANQLYEVESTDPLVMILVSVCLISVAGLSSWLPARKATRVDPMIALRTE